MSYLHQEGTAGNEKHSLVGRTGACGLHNWCHWGGKCVFADQPKSVAWSFPPMAGSSVSWPHHRGALGASMGVCEEVRCKWCTRRLATLCLQQGAGTRKAPCLVRSSLPVRPPGLAAVTRKMLQHMKSLEGTRRKGLKIKLHEVEEQ